MKRSMAAVCIAFALAASACGGGGDESAASTPTPAPSYRPGEAPAYQQGKYPLLGPAGKARNTVDQLDQIQQEREANTGGGAYSPTE